MTADLFGLEQQEPRKNDRKEPAALVEVLQALRSHSAVARVDGLTFQPATNNKDKHMNMNMNMNITARNCGNCAAFNPAPQGDEQACGNLVYFVVGQGEQETFRDPSPVDLCPSHLTVTEDAHENALIREYHDIGGVYAAIGASSSVAMARDAVRKASGGVVEA